MFTIFCFGRFCFKLRFKLPHFRNEFENAFYSTQLAESAFRSSYRLEKANQKILLDSLTFENEHEKLASWITPYWNLTYDEQLQKKQNHCHIIIEKIEKSVQNLTKTFTCDLRKIIPSPVTEGYRNKDEFSVRFGIDGNSKTVGFLIGKLSLGRVVCIRGTHLLNIRESHKNVAQVFEDFIRLSSKPACIKLFDGGIWKTLLVRSNEAGEIMACVTVHPGNCSKDEMIKEQKNIRDYFLMNLPNISLFFQVCPHTRCTHDIAPFNLLYGKPYLMETLKDYTFKISPDTFFQVNKLGAEVLYDTALKMANLKNNTTLLDICSGTGIISILASKFVRGAVGIEVVPQSVRDAKYSAQLNNVENVDFILGRVEKKLNAVLNKLDVSSDIVAVMNPGRAGVDMKVIDNLRRSTQISRIVYISCKPDSPNTIKNFFGLCSKTTPPFPPFRLTKAVPVDLFPHTEHVELILLFQR